jgi:predicted TIM-barrel fold metal-dependent hydrolase
MDYRVEQIPYTKASLVEDMQYYRIHAAAVYSNPAKEYSFVQGNNELFGEIDNKRIFGVATVIPGLKYEVPNHIEYLDSLVNKGAKAFICFPKKLTHSIRPVYLENLASFMVEKQLPLFLDIANTSWDDISESLKAFPELKIVVLNASWGDNRYVFPLMDKFSNLFIDISSNQANDILDNCKLHFGIDRVLFGSNYPYKVCGAVKSLIEYSRLSESDKDKVAYKNAAALLKLNIDELKPYPDEACLLDRIALKMDCGKPLDDVPVIDAHTHMVDTEHITVSHIPIVNGDEDNLIRRMDSLGIDKIFVSPWEGLHSSGINANETSIKAMAKYPGRIEAYAMCNPNYEEDLRAVVDEYHKKHRFIGLKPYYRRSWRAFPDVNRSGGASPVPLARSISAET